MKITPLLLTAGLAALAGTAAAQSVIDNGPELIVSGLFNSGTTPDVAVVDKQTGQVRTGQDTGAGLTWSGPLLTGLADVSSVTSGRLGLPLNEGLLLVSRTGNQAVRVSPLDAASPPVLYPVSAPSAAVALDFTAVSATSNTNGLWLASTAFAPSPFPEVINLVTPSSTALSATSGAQGALYGIGQGQRVRTSASGNLYAAFTAPETGHLQIYQSIATGIPALPWRPQLLADFSGLPWRLKFSHEFLLPGGQAMFFFSGPGSANVFYAPGVVSGALTLAAVATGIVVDFIVPVNTPGAQGFIAFPDTPGPAKYFAWNGSAFTLAQSIPPPAGGRWTGALPGAGLKLLHGPATGGGTSGWQHWPLQGNGQFAFSSGGVLPGRIVSMSAHVFTFTHEPFVSPLAALTDSRQVTDWTSGPPTLSGTRVMNITRETYAGAATGLGSPVAYNAGLAPVGSAWILTNQYAPDTSVAALSPAKITVGTPTVAISPPPQHRQLASLTPAVEESLTFTATSGALVYSRTSPSDAFALYNAASPPVITVTGLPQTSTVEYFAQAGGVRSRLHLAVYTYGTSPALSVPPAADLDGDGLADSWEAYYGQTDPNADPDGDGMNNLTEQNTGSDPLGPCQPGELPELSLAIAGGSIQAKLSRPVVPGEKFQTSDDLQTWHDVTLTPTAVGYTLPVGPVRQFVRIRKP